MRWCWRGWRVLRPAPAPLPRPPRRTVHRPGAAERRGRCCSSAGGVLTASAAIWLVFLTSYHEQPSAERAFCRVGFCDTEAVLEHAARAPAATPNPNPCRSSTAAGLPAPRPRHAGPVGRRWPMRCRPQAARAEAEAAIARAMMLDRSPQTLLNAAAFWFQRGERAARPGAHVARVAARAQPPTCRWRSRTPWTREGAGRRGVAATGCPTASAAQAYLRFLIGRGPAGRRRHRVGVDAAAGRPGSDGGQRLHRAPDATSNSRRPRPRPGQRSCEHAPRAIPTRTASSMAISKTTRAGIVSTGGSRRGTGVATAFDAAITQFGRAGATRAVRRHAERRRGGRRAVGVSAPGRYQFRAYVKTDAISTDQGVAFRLVHDDAPAALNVTTEAVRGSHDWMPVEQVVEAPPNGGLVRVMVVRKPSLRFDNLVRGTRLDRSGEPDAAAVMHYSTLASSSMLQAHMTSSLTGFRCLMRFAVSRHLGSAGFISRTETDIFCRMGFSSPREHSDGWEWRCSLSSRASSFHMHCIAVATGSPNYGTVSPEADYPTRPAISCRHSHRFRVGLRFHCGARLQRPAIRADPCPGVLHLGYVNVFFGYPWLNPCYWTLAIELQYYLLVGCCFLLSPIAPSLCVPLHSVVWRALHFWFPPTSFCSTGCFFSCWGWLHSSFVTAIIERRQFILWVVLLGLVAQAMLTGSPSP